MFLSPVLTKDVRLSGTAVLNLRAALGTAQSNLSAVVAELGPTTQISRTGDGYQNTTRRTCWGATSTDNNACPTLGAECSTTGIGIDNACYLEVSKRVGPVTEWRVTRGTIDSRQRNSTWYQDASPVVPGEVQHLQHPAAADRAHLQGRQPDLDHRDREPVRRRRLGQHPVSGQRRPADHDRHASEQDHAPARRRLAVAGRFRRVTDPQGTVGGTVPATLGLTLGANAAFAPFTPGVAKEYEAGTTANVISTAADAALTVSDPGRLTNGAFSLAEPLRVEFSKSAWTGPVSNDKVDLKFKQLIKANDPLRTGTYSKTLTFTLSTTTPYPALTLLRPRRVRGRRTLSDLHAEWTNRRGLLRPQPLNFSLSRRGRRHGSMR